MKINEFYFLHLRLWGEIVIINNEVIVMDFMSNINLKKSSLTKNEMKACTLICDDLSKVQHFSLSELSDAINVSKTSILRFTQKMGYSGYSEFKFDCIKYVNSLANAEDNYRNENDTTIMRIGKQYSDVINLMQYTIDEQELIKLVALIKNCRLIRCAGIINSLVTAYQIRYALIMFGYEASVMSDAEELHAIDMVTNENDLIIFISASGRKSEMGDNIMQLKEQTECKVALITMNASSPYKSSCDSFILLPQVASLKAKSLLDSVPIYSVFVAMLTAYVSAEN